MHPISCALDHFERIVGDLRAITTGSKYSPHVQVVAEIVWAAPEVRGVIYNAGETVSYGRLAEILERVWGRRVGREDWSVGMLKEELARTLGDGLKKYRVVFAEGKDVAWSEEETFNKKRGLRSQGVEGWVRVNI